MNSLTYFTGNQQKKSQIGCGLGAKFIPNYVQSCEKNKQAIPLDFFHILLGDSLLKQEAVIVKPPDWKFMAIMAENAKF